MGLTAPREINLIYIESAGNLNRFNRIQFLEDLSNLKPK
jgi:hypothetical protein